MIQIVKGFSVVNEAEVDIFLEFPCIFYDPMYVGNLISGISKLTFKILLFFILYWNIVDLWASLVAQLVKNLPARQEALVLFLSLKDHLEKRWVPTPVFLPGEFHGQRSLVGCSPWCCSRTPLSN